MDSPKIMSPQALKQKHQSEVLRLFHSLETAEALIDLTLSREISSLSAGPTDSRPNPIKTLIFSALSPSADIQKSTQSESETVSKQNNSLLQVFKEEIKRQYLLGLGPDGFADTLERLLSDGHMSGCVYACQRHMRSSQQSRIDFVKMIQKIPATVSAEEYLSFVGQVVVPFLTCAEEETSPFAQQMATSGPKRGKEKEKEKEVARVVGCLCDRAEESERLLGRPFEAILYVELAEKLINMTSPSSSSSSSVSEGQEGAGEGVKGRVERLKPDLVLQAAVLRRWKEKLSLADVQQLGLEGGSDCLLDHLPWCRMLYFITLAISF